MKTDIKSTIGNNNIIVIIIHKLQGAFGGLEISQAHTAVAIRGLRTRYYCPTFRYYLLNYLVVTCVIIIIKNTYSWSVLNYTLSTNLYNNIFELVFKNAMYSNTEFDYIVCQILPIIAVWQQLFFEVFFEIL